MQRQKRNRIIGIIILLSFISSGVAMILYNLNDNIVFFHPPSEIQKIIDSTSKIRVGGLVKKGSIIESQSGKTKFIITDNINDLKIEYDGILPALFREGQGIVAEGMIDKNLMIFKAKKLLTKHDENYMPPEVAKSLNANPG